jgi:hypothetical protein
VPSSKSEDREERSIPFQAFHVSTARLFSLAKVRFPMLSMRPDFSFHPHPREGMI